MKDNQHVILLIDDDQDILDSSSVILEGEGYVVERASTAEEGLRVFKQTHPDLVIVDLMMEEIDSGTTFVTQVRALRSDVPIYLLSSVGDKMNENASYSDLGLTGVLQKPINPSLLIATLKKKLRR